MRKPLLIALLLLPSAAPAAGSEEPNVADIQDNRFAPVEVGVSEGTRVTWIQSGTNPHSVTADDGSFDSGPNCPTDCLTTGARFRHTFREPGTFRYYCRIHGGPGGSGMSGVVRVLGVAKKDVPEVRTEEDDELASTGGTPLLPLAGGAVLIGLAVAGHVYLRRTRSTS